MPPETPARVHIPAKPDYRVDQILRYMRRHNGTAMYTNVESGYTLPLTIDETMALEHHEIRDFFNAAREKGYNQ